MTQDQLNQLAIMFEAAAKIMRSEQDPAIKINTLDRIGGTATFFGKKWGDEIFNQPLDSLEKPVKEVSY